ncbi:MAG: hypothetical protein HYV27_12235 [Candidatus Hydrogenedentes bacterium]|nr:hypothetical protein [Candidatus Hydrogenedentota bacterium]
MSSGLSLVFVVFIVFAFLFCALALIAWMIVSLVHGGSRRHSSNEEESRMIQELHQGMNKMEQRVESLETLVLERERGREHERI